MPQQHQWERLAQRRERFYADGRAVPRHAVPTRSRGEAARRPGLRIAEVMATVMQGYADRPALGQRARESRDRSRHAGARRFASCRGSRPSPTRTCGRGSRRSAARLAPPRPTSGARGRLRLRTRVRQHRLHRHRNARASTSAPSWCRCRPARRRRNTRRSWPRPQPRDPRGRDRLSGNRRRGRPSRRTAPRSPDRLRLRVSRRRPARVLRRRGARGWPQAGRPLTIETIGDVVDARRGAACRAAARRGRRRRPAGVGVLHIGQHRHAQGRDVHRKPVHRDVARAVRSAGDHAELHADEPPDRLRLRHPDAWPTAASATSRPRATSRPCSTTWRWSGRRR